MSKKIVIAFFSLFVVGLAFAAGVYFFRDNIAMLNPGGLVAWKEKEIMFAVVALMLLVVIPVFVLAFVFAWKYRADNTKADYTPDWEHSWLAEGIWWGFPLLIVVFLSIIAWNSSHELNPYKPLNDSKKPMTVQVVALQWKWLFIYPEHGVAAVNFAQIPENTQIAFQVSADAPMNSFWVPQLGGQIYAMPGMKTQLHLIANRKGDFRGSSANISGRGFSGMHFVVRATSEEDFDSWIQSIKESSPPMGQDEYQQLAAPSEYNPVTTYTLAKRDLFDWIATKPMRPPETNSNRQSTLTQKGS